MTDFVSREDLEKMKNEIIQAFQESIYSVSNKKARCYNCSSSWECNNDFTCAFDCERRFVCSNKVTV